VCACCVRARALTVCASWCLCVLETDVAFGHARRARRRLGRRKVRLKLIFVYYLCNQTASLTLLVQERGVTC